MFKRLLIETLPLIPRPMMRRLASRYIAGETLEDALGAIRKLQADGYAAILDILGEGVEDEAAAREAVRLYGEASATLQAADLDAYVSVKPTHLGLDLSEELCFELYDELAQECARTKRFLRVEMEDHPTIDGTLRVFERLRERHEHVGIVLQSRLFRTPDDIRQLAPGPLDVRMVKGIYLEPESIAHTANAPITDAYVECVKLLIERGATLSLATHDEALATRLFALLAEHDVAPERYELQVLMGVRRKLWRAWRDAGHRVRVYVPYGPEWRPYSIRRLRHNPQIFGHVMRDFLSFGTR